jgi:Secretion system C-terminal sorting domain
LADTLQGFSSYKIIDTVTGKAIPIPAGDFYVGYQNVGDVKIPIGLDRNNIDKTQYLYQYLNGSWAQMSVSQPLVGALMMRPILGGQPVRNSSTLKINDIPLSEVMTISPNPASDRLYFDLKKGISEDYEISVYNIAGQLKSVRILRGNEMIINELGSGLYFLKIRNIKNNLIFNHKFVVKE